MCLYVPIYVHIGTLCAYIFLTKVILVICVQYSNVPTFTFLRKFTKSGRKAIYLPTIYWKRIHQENSVKTSVLFS